MGVAGTELEAAVQQLYAPVELAGGEELVGAGEVVGHCERRWAAIIIELS